MKQIQKTWTKDELLSLLNSDNVKKICFYNFRNYDIFLNTLNTLVHKYNFNISDIERNYIVPSEFDDDGFLLDHTPLIVCYLDTNNISTFSFMGSNTASKSIYIDVINKRAYYET